MHINHNENVKIKGSIYEWRALKDKMEKVKNDPTQYPAPDGTLMCYMWAYSFLDAMLLIYKKSIKHDLYNTKKEQTITIPMLQAISIHLTCKPLEDDPRELFTILSQLDQQIPIEISKSLLNYSS